MAVCNSAMWTGIIITGQVAPLLLTSPLGVSGTLLLFAANVAILFLVVLFFLPETKVCEVPFVLLQVAK